MSTKLGFLTVLAIVVVAGAVWAAPKEAAPGQAAPTLRDAKCPAWSLHADQKGMIVAVSPVRKSVQIFSSTAAVIGTGVDAVINDKYRKEIDKALGDYDPNGVFEKRIEEALAKAVPAKLTRVPALESTAGYQSAREANNARYANIGKQRYDVLLDLTMMYGIFSYQGLLIAKIQGRLTQLPAGGKLWEDTIVISPEPILASDKLQDPSKEPLLSISAPHFTVNEEAMAEWTKGDVIRSRFEKAANGAVSALICDLGLASEPEGEFYLGRADMNRKKFKQAAEHFRKAIELDPKLFDAVNGLAVDMARNKQLDDAMKLELDLTKKAPDYGPAWYNLAWWYAFDKKDRAAAKPYYEKAVALGVHPAPKLEKAMGKG